MPANFVPRREPELVEAEAKQRYFGDDEKVATTSVTELLVEGVSITSRYGKAHELELMASVVRSLPSEMANRIFSMWCDNKACACYSVMLNPCSADEARHLGEALDYWFCERSSGHNGISVDGPAGVSHYIDCNWPLDEAYLG